MAKDTTPQHTREPWEYKGKNGCYELYVRVPMGGTIKVASLDEYAGHDARRIVACVNACAGISTEALEAGGVGELIEALGAMFKQFYYDNGGLEAVQKARKALNAVGWEWKKGDAPC